MVVVRSSLPYFLSCCNTSGAQSFLWTIFLFGIRHNTPLCSTHCGEHSGVWIGTVKYQMNHSTTAHRWEHPPLLSTTTAAVSSNRQVGNGNRPTRRTNKGTKQHELGKHTDNMLKNATQRSHHSLDLIQKATDELLTVYPDVPVPCAN